MKHRILLKFPLLLSLVAASQGCGGPSASALTSPEATTIHAATTTAGAPSAQSTALQAPKGQEIVEAVRRRDQKRAEADADPAAVTALAHLRQRRLALGLAADHDFQIQSVNEDEAGAKHVRLSQQYKGVRVLNATAVVHIGKDGKVSGEDTRPLAKEFRLQTRPELPVERAEALVAARPEHRRDYLIAPRTELVILPLQERFVKATGARVTGKEQELNALDVERRTVEHKLAWQIDTLEPGVQEPFTSMRYLVDARSGEFLSAKSLSSSVEGTGHSLKNNGPANDFVVPIDTKKHDDGNLTWFEPWDDFRKFGVWDEDDSYGANQQFWFNKWGDGKAFMGDDSATKVNRQTAIVDGLYGMQATWDMFAQVFNRFGYDNRFYEGNAYVHAGKDWDDAKYYYLSGNIAVGDGPSTRRSARTSLDTLAHEFGHGLNDFSAELGGNAEGEGLNEANSDIIGELAEAYERGNGNVNGLTFIPAIPGPTWTNEGSGRSFKNPNGPRYWSSSLAGLSSEHIRAMPMDHAFFFLSQGSVTDPISPMFSTHLPWGMRGIGINKAGRIWILALLKYMTSDTDYADARFACSTAAIELFGLISPEHKAVLNAFAGINVGSRSGDYPADAPSVSESEPNNTSASADPVTPANPPAGAPLSGASFQRTLVAGQVSSADPSDFFSVSVPAGKTLRVTLSSPNDHDLYLYDGFDTLVDSSAAGGNALDQVTVTAPIGGFSGAYTIKVKWYRDIVLYAPWYRLYVDIL